MQLRQPRADASGRSFREDVGRYRTSGFADDTPDILQRSSGIDKKLIAFLPLYQFSSLGISRVGLDCAICLSKFEDTDILHLLPKCKHTFHVSCIVAWLEMHSSCPLCRQRVEAGDISSSTPFSGFQNSISGHELAEGTINDFPNQEDEIGHRSPGTDAGGSSSMKGYDEGIRGRFPKVEHGIQISDVDHQYARHSNVTGSDLMVLSSQTLGFNSIQQVSAMESSRNQITAWYK